jgi:hypothetical protein
MQKRPTGYYFRKAVPLDLIDVLGKREVVESLKTKDLSIAKQRDLAKGQEWEQTFQKLREQNALPFEKRQELLELLKKGALIPDTQNSLDAQILADLRLQNELRLQEHRNNGNTGVEFIRATVSTESQSLANSSYMRDVFNQARIERAEAGYNSISISYDESLGKAAFTASGQKSSNNPRLSDMHKRWERERNAGALAKIEWGIAVKRFIELHGDLAIDAITKANIREFKDALAELPTRLPSDYKKVPLPKILEAVRSGRCVGGEPMVAASINKLLNALSSILSLAVDNGFIENNPAHRVRMPEDKARQGEKRLPYNKEDLKIIFNSPLFKGCRNSRQREIAGNEIIKDHKYWLPLIALYTGARMEEIGQSFLSDIGSEGGVYYLDINTLGDDKSLKTASSRRKVPLHKNIITAGFIEYVERLRKNNETKLFPELSKDKFGRCTRPFSKWYSRYTRELGISDKRKVFHSFRHSFKDACRHAEIEEAIHDALTGHSNGSIGRGYGLGHNIATLNKAIQKIDFGIW